MIAFYPEKGYGFIAVPNEYRHVFCHARDLERAGLAQLNDGDWISFDEVESPRKPATDGAEHFAR